LLSCGSKTLSFSISESLSSCGSVTVFDGGLETFSSSFGSFGTATGSGSTSESLSSCGSGIV
jgi:hypothetical protein